MSEILIRKDGSQSIAAEDPRFGTDMEAIAAIVAEHKNLRAMGLQTGEVTSGAVLEGIAAALALGINPDEFSQKVLAMGGIAAHFGKWQISARESDLYAVSSLSTEIELEDAEEGRQIRGGMGEALTHPRVLLTANYHDEASRREMSEYEKMLAAQGNLLRTESEENDFHAANIAIATGADILMLCTRAEGFIYKGRKLDHINIEDIPKYLAYIEATKSDNRNGIRKGGMKTKLKAGEWALLEAAKQDRDMQVVIGHSTEDSRRLLEDAGTWVVK